MAFATATMPDGLTYRLPRPWGRMPDRVQGTNTEALLRRALEGRDILIRGDSQLTEFRLTDSDVNTLFQDGFLLLEKLIAGQDLSADAAQRLIRARTSAFNIATYYTDKDAALRSASVLASSDRERINAHIEKLFQDKDYASLLDYYHPYFGCLIDADDIPYPPGATESEKDMLLKLRSLGALQSEFEYAAKNNMNPFGWMGRPQKLRDLDDEIRASTENSKRNNIVHTSVKIVLDNLTNALAEGLDIDPAARKLGLTLS